MIKYLPYFLITLSLIPPIVQFTLIRRSRRIVGTTLPPAPEPLAEHLRNHPTCLIYFYSARCMACQDMTPVIDDIVAKHPNVIKLCVTDMPDFARDVGLVATPSSVLIKDGKAVKILTGYNSRKAMEKLLAI
jgi:thioredoxin-like negative regulator of GroEL